MTPRKNVFSENRGAVLTRVIVLCVFCPACFTDIDLSLLNVDLDGGTGSRDGAVVPAVCPASMVRAPNGSFCIDADEVTNEAYALFLAATPRTDQQPSACAFNSTFTPAVGWPFGQGREKFPVANVDWCDARAYCLWAESSLCGKDDWTAACSNDGERIFPYGDAYDPGACNGENGGALAAVRSFAGCTGGFPGLYDMSGNVAEWIDDCQGASNNCSVMGGSTGDDEEKLGCASRTSARRSDGNQTRGFRCCR